MAIPPAEISSAPQDQIPRTALLTNITQQTLHLRQLFSALSAPALPDQQTVNALYTNLQSSTEQLESLKQGLTEHQQAWREMKRKEKLVRDLEGQVRGIVRELEAGRRELESMIQDEEPDDSQNHQSDKKESSLSKVSVSTLLAHARNLAKHSSAPTSTHLSLADKSQFQPWPTETAMRGGILFMQGGGGMGGLGETERQQPGQVVYPLDEDQPMEEIVEEEVRPRVSGAVFDLDLNSDSDDD